MNTTTVARECPFCGYHTSTIEFEEHESGFTDTVYRCVGCDEQSLESVEDDYDDVR